MRTKSTFALGVLAMSFAALAPASAASSTVAATVAHGGGAHAVGDVPGAHDLVMAGRRIAASAVRQLDLRLSDGVELTLEPGASGVLLEPGELPAETTGWVRGNHFRLDSGRIELRIPNEPRGKRAFTVSTRAGTLTGWRGTVEISARGDAVVAAAYEGALAVGSNGVGIRVADGGGVSMHRGVNPLLTGGAPPTPVWQDGNGLALAGPDAPTDLALAWRRSDRATEYGVEVAKDPKMLSIVHRATVGATSARFGAPGAMAEATYFVRVRAIDADGLPSRWSDVSARRVVRVGIPAGGAMGRDGAFVIPRMAAVTLGATDGLEVAYERNPGDATRFGFPLAWMPAPRALRIEEGNGRVVHVRDIASGSATTMTLAARALRAKITVGPARATWPHDPIDVSVTISDPTGRIDAAAERISLTTHVGIAPIAAEWQREGSTYRTRIDPLWGSGPWVVRVTASDSLGEEIGHGFLEIIADAKPARR